MGESENRANRRIGSMVRRRWAVVTFGRRRTMCRSIKILFNFDPPATHDEIRAASLQFVRKLSGFTAPSKANEAAFNQAVDDVYEVAHRLVEGRFVGLGRRR